MRNRLAILLAVACLPVLGQKNLSGTPEIELALKRLNSLGSVLMIAAHPDDENTALLAYFARGRSMRTGYLSLTRGEGGQNLIGSEQGDLLGVIRTEELLAARKIDGAEQFFTRAIDFGFTKSPDEAFAKWGRDRTLGDVVWVIRRFQPDVIVLRFSGTPRDGHGQHQASAILGREAFKAAADPDRFPEQLQWVRPWQAKRLLFNIFTFSTEQEREAQKTQQKVTIDTGEFDPVLGHSYSEIAGMSRSQHESQGMGAPERRGASNNFLTTIEGELAKEDVFDGVDTTWKRMPGGDKVAAAIEQIEKNFEPSHPDRSVAALLDARALAAAIDDERARRKLPEFDETVALCAGLWADISAERYSVVPGGKLKLSATIINRSRIPATLLSVKITGAEGIQKLDLAPAVLTFNQPSNYSVIWDVPETQPYTQPFWLEQPKEGMTYRIARQQDIGRPRNPPLLEARFRVRFETRAGTPLTGASEVEIVRPVEQRYVDRVRGELTRPIVVAPPATVEFAEKSLIFASAAVRKVEVMVTAQSAGAAGQVSLKAPAGWRISPPEQPFQLESAGQQTSLSFEITPPERTEQGPLSASLKIGEKTIPVSLVGLNYTHIPPQTIFPPAQTLVVRADIQTLAKRVGYVMGAGDEVPQALRQIGCDLTLLTPEDLARGDFARFDAIITGVRAYNVRPDLRANQQHLMDYVNQGGTLVVQYNVAEGGFFGGDPKLLDRIGPYPMKIGRDRVTVEEAPVAFPNPAHPLLQSPNKITSADFDGWIQERGLYFASEWDPKYEPLFECHDPGESPLPGGTLFARFGKGAYVFSAYSWFRELPAGVPGAFRIFANLLSASKTLQATP